MTVKGIRKCLGADVEAQRHSVEAAEREQQERLDRLHLRRSVIWYDAKTAVWLEIEMAGLGSRVLVHIHASRPVRHVCTPSGLKWVLTLKETGERLWVEAGFVADGLPHAIWVSGGQWGKHGFIFESGRSKSTVHSQLVTGIGRVPDLFWKLYGVRVSIPEIQSAFSNMAG